MFRQKYNYSGIHDKILLFLPNHSDVSIGGSGHVSVSKEIGEDCKVNKTGSGKLTIQGAMLQNSTFYINGEGNVIVRGAIGENCVISKSGGGDLYLCGEVSSSAKLDIGGSGCVNFKIKPPQAVIDNIKRGPMATLIIEDQLVPDDKKNSTSEKDLQSPKALNVIKVELNAGPLQQLQKVYSSHFISLKTDPLSDFTSQQGMFLYANDQDYIRGYFEKCFDKVMKKEISRESCFTLLDSIKKPSKYDLAVIVGNGNLLSLIPDYSEKYFILLDQEPSVHYFILKVREIILNHPVNDNFDKMRNEIILKIKELEDAIYNYLFCQTRIFFRRGGIEYEIKSLGDKHFLSSRARFENCKKSLQSKEILPIHGDMLCAEQMKNFGSELRKANFNITFMNMTNMPDYDRGFFPVLPLIINQLPLAEHHKIISTFLIGYTDRGGEPTLFVSTNKSELSNALECSRNHNKPPSSYEASNSYR